MGNKYHIGDEVEVSFIGKITEICLSDDKICYEVSKDNTYARRVEESQISLLPVENNDYQPRHPDDK